MIRSRLHRYLLSALLCSALASAATTESNDAEEFTGKSIYSAQIEGCKNMKFKQELRALEKAAGILDTVSDERTAKSACQRIRLLFRTLPPLIDGSNQELELLAKVQNLVNRKMWARINEPYFEASELQQVWTLMTDPFSRPSASR